MSASVDVGAQAAMSSADKGAVSFSLYSVIFSTVWRKSPGSNAWAKLVRTFITSPVGAVRPASRRVFSISSRVGGLS